MALKYKMLQGCLKKYSEIVQVGVGRAILKMRLKFRSNFQIVNGLGGGVV